MKIYTKSGDKGTTSLVSGRRVEKSELLLESYGTVDELNSFVGLLIEKANNEHSDELHYIQNVLFNIGSILAQDGADYPNYPELREGHIDFLERHIDSMDEELPPLKNFILPGGSDAVAMAHVCRTICRRAERRVVALEDSKFELVVAYLNRLSDYFFTLARSLTHSNGLKEVIWNPNPDKTA